MATIIVPEACPSCQAKLKAADIRCSSCGAWTLGEQLAPDLAHRIGLDFMFFELEALRRERFLLGSVIDRIEARYVERLSQLESLYPAASQVSQPTKAAREATPAIGGPALPADGGAFSLEIEEERLEGTAGPEKAEAQLEPAIPSSAQTAAKSEAARPTPSSNTRRQQRFLIPVPIEKEEPPGISWERLRPLMTENLGWFVGAFLIVTGSFYATATWWNDLSAIFRNALVLGLTHLYAAAFVAGACYLGPRPEMATAARVLAALGVALIPPMTLPLKAILTASPGAGIAALLATTYAASRLCRAAIVWISAPDTEDFANTYLPLALSAALLAASPMASPIAYLAFIPFFLALRRFNLSRGRFPGERGFAFGLHAYAFGVVVALAMAASTGSLAPFLPLVPLLGGSSHYADLAQGRWKGIVRLYFNHLPGMVGLWLLIGCLILGAPTALTRQGHSATIIALLFDTVILMAVALGYRSRWVKALTHPALLLVCLGIPALVRETVNSMLQASSVFLGYAGRPLPLQWYALTMVPYQLIELGLERLWRKKHVAMADDSLRWLGGIACVLVALAYAGSDVRPALLAIPVQAVLLYEIWRRIRQGWPIYLAHAGLACWLWTVCQEMHFGLHGWVIGLSVGGWLMLEVASVQRSKGAWPGLTDAWLLTSVGYAGVALLSSLGWAIDSTTVEQASSLIIFAPTLVLARAALLQRQNAVAFTSTFGALVGGYVFWRVLHLPDPVIYLAWSAVGFQALSRLSLRQEWSSIFAKALWQHSYAATLLSVALLWGIRVEQQELFAAPPLASLGVTIALFILDLETSYHIFPWFAAIEFYAGAASLVATGGWRTFTAAMAGVLVSGGAFFWSLRRRLPTVVQRPVRALLTVFIPISLWCLVNWLNRRQVYEADLIPAPLIIWAIFAGPLLGRGLPTFIGGLVAWLSLALAPASDWFYLVTALGCFLVALINFARRHQWLPQLDGLLELAGRVNARAGLRVLTQLEARIYCTPLARIVWLMGMGVWLVIGADGSQGLPGLEAFLAGLGLALVAGSISRHYVIMTTPALVVWGADLGGPLTFCTLSFSALVYGSMVRKFGTSEREADEMGLETARLILGMLSPFLALAWGLDDGSMRSLLRTPMLPLTLAMAAATAGSQAFRLKSSRRLELASFCLYLAVTSSIMVAGVLLDHGRPEAALFPPFALASALLSILYSEANLFRPHHKLARSIHRLARIHQILTLFMALMATLLLPISSGTDHAMVIAALLATTAFSFRSGLVAQDSESIYVAELAFLGAWFYLRFAVAMFEISREWDPIIVAGFAFGALGLGELAQRRRLTVLTEPMDRTAFGLPFFALGWSIVLGMLTPGIFAVLGSIYLLGFFLQQRRSMLLLSLLFYNGMLSLFWYKQGWTNLQLYAIPLGLTAVLLTQLYRNTLDRWTLNVLRMSGASIIYAASFYESVLTPANTLLLILLSLAGMGLGALVRIRSYLYLGTGFLLAAVGLNLVRFGLQHQEFWAVYLTLLGLAILALMMVWTLRRKELEHWHSQFLSWTRDWD